ncbi:MAG: hypothetical protein CMK63_09410 [Pseudoalteromonadaceae bacterium]|nr:hypothetical protein [Pseudoalteromonadaceae bacterium]
MPYFIIAFITLTLLAFKPAHAEQQEHAVLQPPIWLKTSPKLDVLATTQKIQVDSFEHQYLWLPEGHWLEINSELLDKFIMSVGNTQYIQQRIQLERDLLCSNNRCQLPALGHNRIVAIQNRQDEQAEFSALVGHYQTKIDSFKRALKLAKPSILLSSRQGSERFYKFDKGEEVTLYFPDAKKIKLSVRKNMQSLERHGAVYAYVDEVLTAKVNIINNQALEYQDQQVGLVNSDYLAINAGQYLTIRSHTDAYVKITQSHRAIFDDTTANKTKEKLLLPYWLKTANDAMESVYNKYSLNVFSDDVFTHNEPLAVKRHYDLLSLMSTQTLLKGSSVVHASTSSKSVLITELEEQRLVDDQFYPRINKQVRDITSLSQVPLRYDLSSQKRATPWLTFVARSDEDSQLKLTAGGMSWLINIKATQHYQTISVSVPVNHKTMTIQKTTDDVPVIEFAVYARTLTDFPSNEVLYLQPGALDQNSPITAQLVTNHLRKLYSDYLAMIQPYAPARRKVKLLNWQQSMLTAKDLAKLAPLDALAFLKPLTQNPDPSVAEQAWQVKIDILREQHQFHLATSYLEGLYKSTQQKELQQFALRSLLETYQAEQQELKLFALCAGNLNILSECRNILIELATKQQKNRLALWLAHQAEETQIAEQSYTALNYHSLSSTIKAENKQYELLSGAQETLINSQGKLQNTVLSQHMPWQYTALEPVHLSISARTEAKQNGEYQTAWLMADSEYQHKLIPIFSDIPSNTLVVESQQAASVSSTMIVSLQAGETLNLSADQKTFLDVKDISDSLFTRFEYYSDATNKVITGDIMSLIYAYDATQRELLINGLYLLSKKRLNNNEYTQLLQRIATIPASASLTFLQNRIESFGHWQPLDSLVDYAGTRLFDIQSSAQTSFADRFNQFKTHLKNNEGLLIRPFHTLYIDLAQTEGEQIRFVFSFSTAELAQANVANLSIKLANNLKIWSVTEQQSIPFTFNKQELDNNIIALHWLNPYLSQQLKVEAQQYIAGRWRKLDLPTTMLFYSVVPNTPLVATLNADRLIKLEKMNNYSRNERQFFHPAGKIEVKAAELEHVRLYTWELSDLNNKISEFTQAQIPLPDLVTYQAPEQQKIVSEQTSFQSDDLNWQAFILYDQQEIFQSAENIPTRRDIDVGARLRINDENNWYQLEGYYSFSENQTDIMALNGYYSWQDDTTPWYAGAQLQSRWQPGHDGFDSQYALDGSLYVGQKWQRDSTHRHQWQLSPFIRYSSADLNDYLRDDLLNSSVFNFYRENHASGWQGFYQYRYQPWVDNYLNFSVSSSSNDDWTSLDYLRFNTSWNQYYHDHIFQLGIDSYYRFKDENRATATWQYITQFAWQTQINLGDFSHGWLKVRLQQDWVWDNHNISIEFSSGNNQHTGFAPFAHDEIIFPTLQLNHLLEHSDYE